MGGCKRVIKGLWGSLDWQGIRQVRHIVIIPKKNSKWREMRERCVVTPGVSNLKALDFIRPTSVHLPARHPARNRKWEPGEPRPTQKV